MDTKEKEKYTIKVPKGTIVKIEGHPVKLKESLYIEHVDNNSFKIEKHEIMNGNEEGTD